MGLRSNRLGCSRCQCKSYNSSIPFLIKKVNKIKIRSITRFLPTCGMLMYRYMKLRVVYLRTLTITLLWGMGESCPLRDFLAIPPSAKTRIIPIMMRIPVLKLLLTNLNKIHFQIITDIQRMYKHQKTSNISTK